MIQSLTHTLKTTILDKSGEELKMGFKTFEVEFAFPKELTAKFLNGEKVTVLAEVNGVVTKAEISNAKYVDSRKTSVRYQANIFFWENSHQQTLNFEGVDGPLKGHIAEEDTIATATLQIET